MIILGIDPGTATTGFGVIEVNGKGVQAIEWGLIETDKDGVYSKRLIKIYKQMSKIIKNYKPDCIAIEKIFFATNAKTAIMVGQAQGVMLYSAARSNKKIFEYAPGTIKKVVAGNGRADKKEMQKALRKHFGAKVRSKKKGKTHFDNAADALAIALCHAFSMNLPRANARGFFSSRYVGSEIPPKRKTLRVHPRAYAQGVPRRRINNK